MAGSDLLTFNYRPLGEQDIAGIARVHWRACSLAYSFMNWSYTEQEVQDWYAGKFHEWHWGLVAEARDIVVGFAACRNVHLDQLFIDPAYQMRGLGTRMLRAAIERTPGAETLNVFEQNIAARQFYEKHGFREVERFLNEEARSIELLYRRAKAPIG